MKRVFLCAALFAVSGVLFAEGFASAADSASDPRFSPSQRRSEPFRQKQFINVRGGLPNCAEKFRRDKFGRVAFLGGSITEMRGWRNMVQSALRERFPDAKFEFVDAGISSTGSTPGAFRLENDILSKGKIDLLFIENAVNDDTNGFSPKSQIRGMEGEIRRALLANPETDIVVLHFIYDPFIAVEARGDSPEVVKNHEIVCEHYSVASINLCREIALRMRDGEFDWKKFGGTHPSPFGHKYYAAAVENLFDEAWKTSAGTFAGAPAGTSAGTSSKISAKASAEFPAGNSAKASAEIPAGASAPRKLPEPLDKFSYFRGRFIPIENAKVARGWRLENNWKPASAPAFESGGNADTLYSFEGGAGPARKAHTRRGFVNVPMLEARAPGAEFSLEFEGTAVGIFCVAGPYAGTLEYSIDGTPFSRLDTFTHWSGSIYLPWVYLFADELAPGKHVLTVRMSGAKNAKSFGHECQIRNFVAN